MEVSGQFNATAALSHGKSPRYTLDRRLRGPQSRSWRGGEVQKSLGDWMDSKTIWMWCEEANKSLYTDSNPSRSSS
jgi:hypothetical protein